MGRPPQLMFLRIQNDPRPLPHLQMILGIHEQRLLERRLADFEVVDPRQDLVRGAVQPDLQQIRAALGERPSFAPQGSGA
jgi:hypothetical protein